MSVRRFETIKAKEIADFLDAQGVGLSNLTVNCVGTLGNLPDAALTFLSAPTPERIAALSLRDDIVVLTPLDIDDLKCPHIKVENPRLAFAKVLRQFFKPRQAHFIAETAIIDPSAKIGQNVNIGHFSIIGAGVELGDNCFIGNHVEIFENVRLGEFCHIKSQAIIGQDGFGFEKDKMGNYQRLPHIGGVKIDDWVELGCHSTISAGTIEPTLIGSFTKIDDHCHIGHNCKIGRNNIICGGTVISGSVKTEDYVWFGPNSSTMQGLKFEENCTIGVGAVMYFNGKAGMSYGVRPALPTPK